MYILCISVNHQIKYTAVPALTLFLEIVCFSLQGNQILSSLSLDEYKATLKMIKRAILATDLALYMK